MVDFRFDLFCGGGSFLQECIDDDELSDQFPSNGIVSVPFPSGYGYVVLGEELVDELVDCFPDFVWCLFGIADEEAFCGDGFFDPDLIPVGGEVIEDAGLFEQDGAVSFLFPWSSQKDFLVVFAHDPVGVEWPMEFW